MSVYRPSFRTRAFRAPEKTDTAPASPETALLVFWSFHGVDERASEGFIYENEIGGSYNFSKTITPRIGWREAMEQLGKIEAEAGKTLQPAEERAYHTFIRLHRNDSYDRALPYAEHPLLKLEQAQASLHDQAAETPKLARRPKPPRNGGP